MPRNINYRPIANFAADVIVFQQNSIFFLISGVFIALSGGNPISSASILLYFGLSNQLLGNFLLSRECALQIASSGANRTVFKHTFFRAIILISLAIASIPISIKINKPLFVVEILYSVLIMITIAGQAIHQVSQKLSKDYLLAVIAALGSLSFVIYTWNILLGGIWVATLILVALVKVSKQGAVEERNSGVMGVNNMFTPGRIGLWAATLASSEYDRYLIARGGRSVEGVSLGLFGSLINVPLAIASSVGPRLIHRPFGDRENRMIIGAGFLYLLVVLAVAWNILKHNIFALLAGSAVKILSHLFSNREYYLIMTQRALVPVIISTVASAIAVASTFLIIAGEYYAAAAVKIFAGVVFSLSIGIVYVRLKGDCVEH